MDSATRRTVFAQHPGDRESARRAAAEDPPLSDTELDVLRQHGALDALAADRAAAERKAS